MEEFLDDERMEEKILDTIDELIELKFEEMELSKSSIDPETAYAIFEWFYEIINNRNSVELSKDKNWSKDELRDALIDVAKDAYKDKIIELGDDIAPQVSRLIALQSIDKRWKDHLYEMDGLREGISYQAYAQKDPLIEYKFQAFKLFQELIKNINTDIVKNIFRVHIVPTTKQKNIWQINRTQHEEYNQFRESKSKGSKSKSFKNPHEEGVAKVRNQVVVGKKIGRNDLCPCGSGKKFKKCHLGREDELILEKIEVSRKELGRQITSLPEVRYGRSKEIIEAINIQKLTGKARGIKFINLKEYLTLVGSNKKVVDNNSSASQIVNLNKTRKSDPNNIYIAITPNTNDSTLIHQIAHVLGYLKDSIPLPGTFFQISEETEIPAEQLDHPKEFGNWLDYLKDRFDVELDAEDKIISFLNENGILLTGEEVRSKDRQTLISRSTRIFNFLKEHREEIDLLIKDREGYVGSGGS